MSLNLFSLVMVNEEASSSYFIMLPYIRIISKNYTQDLLLPQLVEGELLGETSGHG